MYGWEVIRNTLLNPIPEKQMQSYFQNSYRMERKYSYAIYVASGMFYEQSNQSKIKSIDIMAYFTSDPEQLTAGLWAEKKWTENLLKTKYLSEKGVKML